MNPKIVASPYNKDTSKVPLRSSTPILALCKHKETVAAEALLSPVQRTSHARQHATAYS